MSDLKVILIRQASEALQLYGSVTSRDIADGAVAAGVKLERGQIELDKPIKSLGAHKIKVHLHPEVTVDITALVARSPDEAEFLAKGGALVAETERAQLEAAEAARRAAEQAAALFEAKPAETKPAEGEATEAPAETEQAPAERARACAGAVQASRRMPSQPDGMRFLLVSVPSGRIAR
jgi:large subunit ribosomal protein L9